MTQNYFEPWEIVCPCCGLNNWDPNFHKRMNLLRERCGFPIRLSSACRCIKHNHEVGGGDLSAHLEGLGADILCSGTEAYIILAHATELRFSGIGIKQTGPHDERIIHLDDALMIPGRPRPWIWSY